MAERKSLVSYFSRKGDNYVGGNIINLTVGNTEVVAKKIQKATESDLFEIKTIKEYPEDYTKTTEIAKEEVSQNIRPELTQTINDMEKYDIIYLGYPNWWGTMPMVVFSFLEAYDFSGKTIIPFCTHEGSSMGSSEKDINRICPDSKILKGLSVWGNKAEESYEEIQRWLKNIKE